MGSDALTDAWYFLLRYGALFLRLATMAASPLLGYNTNVRHLGKLYHIQTEDSGTTHGHIFTHLFADGGRVIASKKTTYAQYIESNLFPDVVKRLMRESHKAMFIALRDGLFDEDEVAGAATMAAMEITVDSESSPKGATPSPAEGIDVDELERAAEARLAQADAAQVPAAKYSTTRPAAVARRSAPAQPNPQSESIFGGDLLSEKSLDEVILSYLAEDVEDEG
ncbi:hypothetical protein JYT86_00100 [bacterium AH-315-N03]|nr:hypothetical protein [bacterium AH-315-N03]